MSAVKERNLVHLLNNEDEPPTKKLISEADVFIKRLAEKQRNTVTNLQEQLTYSKEFTKSTDLVPLGSYSAGTSSLKHFQETTQHFDQVDRLKSAGLAGEEIQLYFDSLNGDDYVFAKHKNWELSLLKQRLSEIHKTVNEYEEQQSIVINIEDQDHQKFEEYGLSIKPDSLETKLMKFALQNQKGNTERALPHPMNDIKQTEQKLFANLREPPLPSISKIRRKARKLGKRIQNVSSGQSASINNYSKISCQNVINPAAKSYSLAKESKWDLTVDLAANKEKRPTKTYTCLPHNYYTIKQGEIVKLNKEETVAKGLQVASRLSVEEIKMLPKFKNYERGDPSKILYVRNLSNGVKEEDLRQLLKNYDKGQSLVYRIMKGKMRGQAFITFPDEVVAGQALDEVNGAVIKSRPVVIQFGCGKDKVHS